MRPRFSGRLRAAGRVCDPSAGRAASGGALAGDIIKPADRVIDGLENGGRGKD